MKNNKYIYLLFVIVITIWSLISYKVYNGLNHTNLFNREGSFLFTETTPIRKDSFFMHSNYEDPFLKTISYNTNKIKDNRHKKINNFSMSGKNHDDTISNIIYKGMFQDEKGIKKVAIFSICNRDCRFSINDSISENTILKKIFKDSVQIKKKSKLIIIKKIHS